MLDYTPDIYKGLISIIANNGYCINDLKSHFVISQSKFAIIRHDVDKMPRNALRFAQIEHEQGICATYYFRIVPESFDPGIIRQIASLGHEIGYHYEDMDLCKGDVDKAYRSFQTNLARLREIVPIQTACMHGSPMSKYDNRDIWKKYDYRELGIIGEPYFDIDYNQVFYLTDTGRSWNSSDVSIRDKVRSPFRIKVKNTSHLIELIRTGDLPDQIMINTHPQRWNDNWFYWTRELVWQSVKNQVKRFVSRRSSQKKSAD